MLLAKNESAATARMATGGYGTHGDLGAPVAGVLAALYEEATMHTAFYQSPLCLRADVGNLYLHLLFGNRLHIVIAMHEESRATEGARVVAVPVRQSERVRAEFISAPLYAQHVPICVSTASHKAAYQTAQMALISRE